MNRHDNSRCHLVTLVLAEVSTWVGGPGLTATVALLLTSRIASGLKTTTRHEWKKRGSAIKCVFTQFK